MADGYSIAMSLLGEPHVVAWALIALAAYLALAILLRIDKSPLFGVALLFAISGQIRNRTGTLLFDDLGGLAKVMPFAGLAFGLGAFAAVGVGAFVAVGAGAGSFAGGALVAAAGGTAADSARHFST